MLQLLLATCNESLAGVRDRALLAFAFASSGRRRSEGASASLEQLRPVAGPGSAPDAAPAGYIYELLHSKINQAGETDEDSAKPVMRQAAAQALTAWLDALRRAGKTNGLAAAAMRLGVRERLGCDITSVRALRKGIELKGVIGREEECLQFDSVVVCAGTASRRIAADLGDH